MTPSSVNANHILFAIFDTSDRIDEPLAGQYCRNLKEFWIIEAEMHGHTVLVESSIPQILEIAAKTSYQYLIVGSLGGFYSGQKEFFEEILSWIQNNKNFYLLGHILDRKENWYELHDQCFVLNLETYRKLGQPSFGFSKKEEQYLPQVTRSEQNFHDDYTPFWIKPRGGPPLRVTRAEGGYNLIKAGIESGLEIQAFPKEIRNSKFFFYPTVQGAFSEKIASFENNINTANRAFYMFNTETIKHIAPDKPFRSLRRLITLCSGLMFFDLLKRFDFCEKITVNFYDVSIPAINMMKAIVQHWDGRDYPQFIKNHRSPDIELFGTKDAEQKWKLFLERFGGEQEWLRFFNRVKSSCEFYFSHANVYDADFSKKCFFDQILEGGDTLLWLSNVFHYRYSSGMRSLRERVLAQDALLKKLQEINPQMLIHMTSALGNRCNMDGNIFRAKEYLPQIELVPHFWKANSSKYPLPVKAFFSKNSHALISPPIIPSEFRQILLETLTTTAQEKIDCFANWIEHKSHIPWLKLDIPIPHAEMLREAQACKDKFVPHRAAHNQGWSSLCLHGLGAEFTEDYNRYGFQKHEDVSYQWTEIAERCPITVNWLKNYWPMESFDRIRYMLLKPGGFIKAHNDMDGKRGLSATNIALNQPTGCEMIFSQYGIIPWRPGEVRRLDVGVDHCVYNGSEDPRYHMIIHGRVGNRYSEWNRLIVRSFLKEHLSTDDRIQKHASSNEFIFN